MSGLRPALRIARRDVRRSPGRSLLIVLMVALPVAGAAFIDVVLRTVDVRGTERIELELGRGADARIYPGPTGNPVLQRPTDTFGQSPTVLTGPGDPAPDPPSELPPVDPLTLLPAGTRAVTDSTAQVQVRTSKGLTRSDVRELDIADPLAQGLYAVVDGRPARTTDEVAVTTALLEELGLSLGDDLEVQRPERTLRIVGTVRPNSDLLGKAVAVGLPGALGDDRVQQPLGLLVDTPSPVTWQQVLMLNESGTTAFSRAVVQDPPPASQVPLLQQEGFVDSSGPRVEELLAVVLVVGLAVAEVALLAGAAFAVGIRRQGRTLGLLAATGGTRRQVRSVVLAQGAVLGAVGGLIGVVIGTVAGIVGVQVARSQLDRFLLPPDLRPVELLALTLVGVLTGLLAAAVPARTASRQDVVAALTGRRGVVKTRRRYPVIGLVTAGVGVALALGGGALALSLQQREDGDGRLLSLVALMILVGAVLTQLGLIVATPAIIGGAARLGRFLPLAPRLALRDAARHRGRTAPAIGAILAAVAGSVALTLFVASQSDKDERMYSPSAAYGQVTLRATSNEGLPRDTAPLLAAVRRIAPPDDVFDVRGFRYDPDCGTRCEYVNVVAPPERRCPAELLSRDGSAFDNVEFDRLSQDERCTSRANAFFTTFSGPVVGGYDDLVRLTGMESSAARDVLRDGGAVVFDPSLVSAGRSVLEIATSDSTTGASVEFRAVPVLAVALAVPPGSSAPTAVLSPQAAARTGVRVGVEGTVLAYDIPPSDDVEEEVSAALAELGEQELFRVERGYRDAYGTGLLALLIASALITLGASGVATGLAQADARGDHATLAAIGAAPRLRRRLTAFQAAVVAGLGALLGTVAGFVPMVAYLYADTAMRFAAPWRNLLVIAFVVPAVAALAAFALTRSRLPLARRTA